MYMYNTFSSQPNLAQQATDGQHHKATTTLSLRFRKKRSSCRYAHGLSRRPQGLKEVTPDVVTSSGRPSARSAPCPCIENVFLPTNSVSVLVHEEADRSANIASLAYCYLHWVICLNFSRFHYFRFLLFSIHQ